MPKNLALSGKHSRKYFNTRGELRHIKGLSYWPIKKVLTDKYYFHDDEAQAFADFLLPMLEWHHDRRATAEEMLEHPWLKMEDNYEFKYTKAEYDKIQFKKQMQGGGAEDKRDGKQEMGELIDSDPELYGADIEEDTTKKRLRGNGDLNKFSAARFTILDSLYDGDSDGGSLMSEDEQNERVET